MNDEPWYSARCLFRHIGLPAEPGMAVYEERIVLFRADSFENATRKAEDEAREYTSEEIEYLGFVELFHLFEPVVGDGSEVFSLMRTSALGSEDYITRFLDTGSERSR
ncbi:MAG: DUF4288 domain-containing protein [Isosphaeraceae bacterium]